MSLILKMNFIRRALKAFTLRFFQDDTLETNFQKKTCFESIKNPYPPQKYIIYYSTKCCMIMRLTRKVKQYSNKKTCPLVQDIVYNSS